jgi:8-oxo-dGTP diphosphatase
MTNATICFIRCTATSRVLLGLKKRGFGRGKLNGFGGKIQSRETPEEATVREVEEECGVIVNPCDLRPAGMLTFVFPSEPGFDHHVRVFTTDAWRGEPGETAEMAPSWFPIDRLPFDRMWADDSHWLPLVLSGRRIDAAFTFAPDNENLIAWRIRTADQRVDGAPA